MRVQMNVISHSRGPIGPWYCEAGMLWEPFCDLDLMLE